jgi:protein SCO1/2
MPRILKVAAVLGLVLFVASSWALVRLAQARAAGKSGTSGNIGTSFAPAGEDTGPALAVPEFSLIDQDSQPFTRESLKGKLTVLNFVFTNCPFVCPTLMDKMHGLSVALKNEQVHFLSISVDPAHDTPASLKAFAELHSADQSRWRFLTGEKAEVDRIVTKGLKFALTDDATRPITLADGSSMSNIIHPSWFVLIGPDAEVLSLYRTDEENLEVLAADVRRWSRGRSGTP